LLNDEKKLDQQKFQLVARLGGDWYSRVSTENLFIVSKPNVLLGIGIDALPATVRNSKILTGNYLGKLANVQTIPAADNTYKNDIVLRIIHDNNIIDKQSTLHAYAASLLEENRIMQAWQVLHIADALPQVLQQ